jgi:Tfp pilus assembly protein PilZ
MRRAVESCMTVLDPSSVPTFVPQTRDVNPDTETAPYAPIRGQSVDPETRFDRRYGYELPITLYATKSFCTGLVRNLSVGGFFVETNERFEVGESCEFDLVLPSSTVWCSGRVSWVSDPDSRSYSGMGITFESVSDALREALRDGVIRHARQEGQDASSSREAGGPL